MPNVPTYFAFAVENGPVPGAGSDPRIQAGATWTNFGPPTIDEVGNCVTMIGKWKAPAFTGPPQLPKQSGTGLFWRSVLIAKVGDQVPGLTGVTWAAFTDPVVGIVNGLVFIATLAGTGVNAGNDTAVCGIRLGSQTVEILAREGEVAAGTFGGTYQSFTSVGVDQSAFVWTALLKVGSGSPAVVGANNAGAWCSAQAGTSYLVVREGQNLANRPLASFQFLASSPSAPGAARGWYCYYSQAGTMQNQILATFSDGTSGFCLMAGPSGEAIQLSGPNSNLQLSLPGVYCATFGLPTNNWALRNGTAFLAKLANYPGHTGVTPANATAIIVPVPIGPEFMPLVRTGDPCPGFESGAVFASLGDPVGCNMGQSVAFMGTASGGGVTPANNVGIWWAPGGTNPQLVAREGGQPPGAPAGTVWKTFTSLAVPGGSHGLIFTAQLADAPGAAGDVITGVNDMGLYGMGADGILRELVREGHVILGKTVKSFNALRAIPGCAGAGRSYNGNCSLVVLLTFTDTTMAIVRVDLP